MRISARCDYACRALLELALHWPNKQPLPIHTISEKQEIPMGYLMQILIQLKRMGLVASIRGKEGGYYLSKPPDRISLGEVIRQIGGPLLPLANSASKRKYVFATVWNEIEDVMAEVVDKITFADISSRARGMDRATVYQI